MKKALMFLKHMKQTDTPYNFRECELEEAIAELEQAMKPKTCEGCKHLFFDEIEEVYMCINDVSDDAGYLDGQAVIRNIKDFYCAQYRSKDNE